jgi:hypothetical protein
VLDWSRVSHYTFLEEFNLLRETRQDVVSKPWADAVVREAMKQHLRVKRAKEELKSCNTQIRRLHTSIRDEHLLYNDLLPQLEASRNPIYGAVHEYALYRRRVNNYILARIYQTYSLAGYTGVKGPGTRKGTKVTIGSLSTEVGLSKEVQELELEDISSDIDEGDNTTDDVGGVVDFVTALPIRCVQVDNL